jgi:hypothetical protein
MNVNKDKLWHQKIFHINKTRLHQLKYMSIGIHNIIKMIHKFRNAYVFKENKIRTSFPN